MTPIRCSHEWLGGAGREGHFKSGMRVKRAPPLAAALPAVLELRFLSREIAWPQRMAPQA